MTPRLRVLLVLAVIASPLARGSALSDAGGDIRQLACAIVEAPSIDEVRLSPDGRWVYYRTSSRSVEANQVTDRHWLQDLEDDANRPPLALPEGIEGVQWRPGHAALSYLMRAGSGKPARKLMLFDVVSRVEQAAVADGSIQVEITPTYRWSPKGERVAFVQPSAPSDPASHLDPTQGMPLAAWLDRSQEGAPLGLYVLTVGTGDLRRVTDPALRVNGLPGSFAWSPDGTRLAFAVDRPPYGQGMNNDLMVEEEGRVRTLVSRPGSNRSPIWSPDSQWIAFATQRGMPDYYGSWPAAVSADGKDLRDFANATKAVPFFWCGDSAQFYCVQEWRMRHALSTAVIADRNLTPPIEPFGAEGTLCFDTLRSLSADRRTMAFVRSTLTRTKQLMVCRWQPDWSGIESLRPIKTVGKGGPDADAIAVTDVSWRSTDGKFDVHGILLTRSEANRPLLPRRPLVVSLVGGPTMVTCGFDGRGWDGIELCLALRGYAVLIPNTRGRKGFADGFTFGLRDGQSHFRLPYEDMMAGIRHLEGEGCANAGQVAVIGHSYGGGLALFSATMNRQLAAVVVHEGGTTDLFPYLYPQKRGSVLSILARDFFGVTDPLAPAEQRRMLAESSALMLSQIEAPVLLQYGVKAHGREVAPKLFTALQAARVRTAAFLYDEGHVFERPAARVDDLVRTTQWIDHWLRRDQAAPWIDEQLRSRTERDP